MGGRGDVGSSYDSKGFENRMNTSAETRLLEIKFTFRDFTTGP